MGYYWQPGTRVSVNAEIAGAELERLEKDGRVTPQAVVDAARSEDSPLHPAFEWDDSVAAEHYRRWEARTLLHSIRIRTEDNQEPQRVYFNIKTEESQSYVSASVVRTDEELRQILINDAMRSLMSARERYREVNALGSVWVAIDQIALEIGAA